MDYLLIERETPTPDFFFVQNATALGVTVANPSSINNVNVYVINIATLKTLTGLTNNTIRQPLGYFTAGDVSMPAYRLRSISNLVPNDGSLIQSAIAGTIWEAIYPDGVVTACSFGVIQLTGHDNAPRLEAFYDFVRASLALEGTIQPGIYNCSRPVIFAYKDNTVDFNHKLISAYGAQINNWLIVHDTCLSVHGITIKGSPTHGFTALRSQGASYEDISVINATGDGFRFAGTGTIKTTVNGVANTVIDTNYQVTRGEFIRCIANGCGGIGFNFLGTATVNRSWCNQTNFSSCSVINCGGVGLSVVEALGPAPQNLASQFNYNTFVNCGFEVNATTPRHSMDLSATTALTFIGGHYANANAAGQAIKLRNCTHLYMFGGRMAGSLDADTITTGVFLVNTDAPAESGAYGFLRNLDFVQTANAEVLGTLVVPNQWSPLNNSLISITPGGTGIHEVSINLASLPNSGRIVLNLEFFGTQGATNTTWNRLCYAEYILYVARASTGEWHADFTLAAQEGVTHDSLVNVGNGVFRIRFDSVDNITAFLQGIYQYYYFGQIYQ